MYLEKLIIKGFKSFQEKTFLEFPSGTAKSKQQSITAIVGPNGAGKSNIADSIRWVLGEQSLKNIRCKKSEDIIFSGSSHKGRANFAEVSIYFNNHDKQADIEFSEISITRRLYRNGESEYLINNAKARLFDILILLAKSNIGTKSFSIIGQGMIDSVIMSTPMERCDFFNEAVGIKHYQIKRDHSLNKLERTENNLEQAQTVLQEIDPLLKTLTKQVKKLNLKKKIESEMTEYQLEYYSRLWLDLSDKLDKYAQQITGYEKQKQAKENQIQSLSEQLDNFQNQSSRQELFEQLQQDLSRLERQKTTISREISILKGKKDIDLTKQGKLNLAWLYQKEEEIRAKLEEKQDHLKQILSQKQNQKKILGEYKKELTENNNNLLGTEEKLKKVKQEIHENINKLPLSKLKIDLLNICAQQNKLLKKIKNLTDLQDLEKLAQEAEQVLVKLNKLKDNTQNYSEEMAKQRDIDINESTQIIDLHSEIKKLIENKEITQQKISQAKVDEIILKEKYIILEDEIAKLQTEEKRISLDIASHDEKDSGVITAKIDKEIQQSEKRIDEINPQIQEINKQMLDFNKKEQEKKEKMFSLEKERQKIQSELSQTITSINQTAIEKTRLSTKKEDLEIEITREMEDLSQVSNYKPYSKDELKNMATDNLWEKIRKLKSQLEQIGGIDPEVIKEYEKTKERHDFLTNQMADVKTTIKSLEKIIIELDDKIKKQFDDSFKAINKEFEKYFKILFEGGKAKLAKIIEKPEETIMIPNPADLTDPQNENMETKEEKITEKKSIAAKYKKKNLRGIEIHVSPPGKKLSNIESLSGGERSMTSIALIAAIISNNPSPLVLLDEVDAALDEANSNKLGSILQELSDKTQFVMITHNRPLMYLADVIYGITMGEDNISKLLSIKIEDL